MIAVCGTASVLSTQEAAAQTAPAPAATLQRVEVTGSNIRRTDTETAAPVQVFTREDIEKSGKASVAEYLQTLSVDNQGSVPTTFGSGFASGASGISLRGLGAQSTLVLINGRRVAPYGLADDGQKSFADLNVIPLEAVERVEILKDGGSAIYGSDAIAGVVNVILRKNFQGTVVKADGGISRYSDGKEGHAALTHGFVKEEAGISALFNLEVNHKDAIFLRDRAGKRGLVGKTDLRGFGYDSSVATGLGGAGGTGAIIGKNNAGSSVVGNVRNPATNEYYSRSNQNTAQTGFTRNFPGADCNALSGGYPQGGDLNGGGCLIDAQARYGQVQPEQNNINFFARGSKTLNAATELYGELNLYHAESKTQTTPSAVSSSVGSPVGPISNAGVALGASHPDNPYFGSAARLRYLAADVGPRRNHVESDFVRALVGAKGTMGAWEYDSGLLFSMNKIDTTRSGFLQRDALFALLNPTAANVAAAQGNAAYRALPAGTFYRIGENAGLNSAAVYSALSPDIQSSGETKTISADFRVNREFGKLEGGPIGVAAGAELRRESARLDPVTGTRTGNIVGLGYSAYDASRTVAAIFLEGLFPVTKRLELSAAARADRYSDVGTSFTPKVGAKFKALPNLAFRGTFAEGFRAPGAAEISSGGVSLSAFSAAVDPVRCAAGVPNTCSANTVAVLTAGNPNLSPEKSKNFTLGTVWDITPKTGLALDFWQIKRKNEINQETTDSAIAAGRVSRDPSTSTNANDPGAITAVMVQFVNSAQTTVRGADLDLKHRMDFEGGHKVTLGMTWTHLFKWERVEQDGSRKDFAGTHGNCDVTNCIGTPADRVNLTAGWENGPWRVAGSLNYRGSLKNVAFKDDPAGCQTTFANGTDSPAGCRIGSFTTVDLGARYRLTPKTEIFGSIQNLFDRVPPHDPTTYGAVGYNPLDYSGAVGRYFRLGLRHQF